LTSLYFAFSYATPAILNLDDTIRSIEAKVIFLTQGGFNYAVFKYCGFFIIMAAIWLDSFLSWCYFYGLFTGRDPLGESADTYRLLKAASVALSGVQCFATITLTVLNILVLR
jgi:hypothetical protein